MMNTSPPVTSAEIAIPPRGLAGTLNVPANPRGIIVFVHGSGSSHLSPRNRAVATALNLHGFATLLFDLLTPIEEADRANIFNTSLLTDRLVEALLWVEDRRNTITTLPIGLFGASTGAAAAIIAAARLPRQIKAVVSRGGRPDLAGEALQLVRAPTLLIVGGADVVVFDLNEKALARLRAPKAMAIVQGATHLFPEPGAMETVIEYATQWFELHVGDVGLDHVQLT